MTEIVTLQPHDPLPEGHSVVLMRRFAEDRPRAVVIEMIVRNPDKSEETSLPPGDHGDPATWEEATSLARQRAAEEGLKRIWRVDRTAGAREQEILAHDGDHSINDAKLVDDDSEEGVQGSDMRDRKNDGAPRRF